MRHPRKNWLYQTSHPMPECQHAVRPQPKGKPTSNAPRNRRRNEQPEVRGAPHPNRSKSRPLSKNPAAPSSYRAWPAQSRSSRRERPHRSHPNPRRRNMPPIAHAAGVNPTTTRKAKANTSDSAARCLRAFQPLSHHADRQRPRGRHCPQLTRPIPELKTQVHQPVRTAPRPRTAYQPGAANDLAR